MTRVFEKDYFIAKKQHPQQHNEYGLTRNVILCEMRCEWRLFVVHAPGIDRFQKSAFTASSYLCPLIFIHLFFYVCECVFSSYKQKNSSDCMRYWFRCCAQYVCEHLSTFDAVQWTKPANKSDDQRYESVRDELNGLHFLFFSDGERRYWRIAYRSCLWM